MSDKSPRAPTKRSREKLELADDQEEAGGSGTPPPAEPGAAQAAVRPKVHQEPKSPEGSQQSDESALEHADEGIFLELSQSFRNIHHIGPRNNLLTQCAHFYPEEKPPKPNLLKSAAKSFYSWVKTKNKREDPGKRKVTFSVETDIATDSDQQEQLPTSPTVRFHPQPMRLDSAVEGGWFTNDPAMELGDLSQSALNRRRAKVCGTPFPVRSTKRGEGGIASSSKSPGFDPSKPPQAAATALPTRLEDTWSDSLGETNYSPRSMETMATFGSMAISGSPNASRVDAPPPSHRRDDESREVAFTASSCEERTLRSRIGLATHEMYGEVRGLILRIDAQVKRLAYPLLDRGDEMYDSAKHYVLVHAGNVWVVVRDFRNFDFWVYCGCHRRNPEETAEEIEIMEMPPEGAKVSDQDPMGASTSAAGASTSAAGASTSASEAPTSAADTLFSATEGSTSATEGSTPATYPSSSSSGGVNVVLARLLSLIDRRKRAALEPRRDQDDEKKRQ